MDRERGDASGDDLLSTDSTNPLGKGRPGAESILAVVNEQRDRMLEFLERLVVAESPSSDPSSQRRVFDLLEAALDEAGYSAQRFPGRDTGGHMQAMPSDRKSTSGGQLLLGHSDTVWPIGTLEQMPVTYDGKVMRGPGIFDMKAGLAQIVFALRTLRLLGLEPPVTPIVLINSDEEIGSVESTPYIELLAGDVSRVFVMEPALGLSGKLKTARKGVGQFEVIVHGKAAHAGLDPESGASAILELSHVIQRLFDLNDPAEGISVNVGTIDGGLRPNVIAPESRATVDVRVPDAAEAERLEKEILGLRAVTDGVTVEVMGTISRHPLARTPRNRALWRVAQRLAGDLGIEIEEGLAGGGSDGSTTSKHAATLDGLGAVGDGAHAKHEHIDIAKTLERCALLAMLVMSDVPREEEDS